MTSITFCPFVILEDSSLFGSPPNSLMRSANCSAWRISSMAINLILLGEFAIVQVIQIVVLVHVLMHGIQFHAPSLVQHFNNLGHAFFFGGFLCHSLYPH